MIREFHGRTLVCCDKCPVRLDLGDSRVVRARNRTPSGWLSAGANAHYCPNCSPHMSLAALFAREASKKPQPLL